MLPFENMDPCTGCGLCAEICAKKCIEMSLNEEGFRYPIIDTAKCIHCRACERTCPSNKTHESLDYHQQCYAAWNNDLKLRKESSSGGLFSAFAEIFLQNGGIIYGAVMEKDFTLHHVRISQREKLEAARRSKYYQSNISEIFSSIRADIKEGFPVLFVGTPCQASAIRAEIHNDNLFCIDLLCHGVTSEKVFLRYLISKRKKYKSDIKSVVFRSKDKEYGGVVMKILFQNDQVYYGISKEDTYMRGFNSNLFLRKSCHQCRYANCDRIGDITLGDFWGIGEKTAFPYTKRDEISFVLVNSEKGAKLVKNLQKKELCTFILRDMEEAKPLNRTLTSPMELNKNRSAFFSVIDKVDFDLLIYLFQFNYYAKYYGQKKIRNMKKFIKQLVRKK